MKTQVPHYEAFVATVRHGSVTAAAQHLGLPRPTLSRYLARLEADLGVALLIRTSRRVSATAAGQRLFERAAPLIDAWESLEHDTRSEAGVVSGTVRLSVSPLISRHFATVVGQLRRDHPELQVEIVSNVRLVDLRGGEFDAAVFAGPLRDPELISRPLITGNVGMVAAPAYLEAEGTPTTLDDLSDHTLVRGHNVHGQPRQWWPLRDGGRFRVDGPLVSTCFDFLREATIDGQGISLLSDLNCAGAIAEGSLVRVMPELVGRTSPIHLIMARRTLMPTRVRVVLDTIAERIPGLVADDRP